MSIVIVDDSKLSREQLKGMLEADGYADLHALASARDLINLLEQSGEGVQTPSLILLDWVLPDMNGIDTVKMLRARLEWRDLPVIMVTSKSEGQDLQEALDAGANDFLTKPIDVMSLLARVRAALRLKSEMDRRKDRENELISVTRRLEEVIQSLQRISTMDAVTLIANRRLFDETLTREWRRATRDGSLLSVIMLDIDFFKAYNDCYGHVAGDDCLKQVAGSLAGALKRPGDLIARYGGEEFAAILPATPAAGAMHVAETLRQAVENLKLAHERSSVASSVTISCGVATLVPKRELRPSFLVAAADVALYEAKRAGRNKSELNAFVE